jgi:hypothetical protein
VDRSEVTITLPLSGHGLGVILTALGIGAATAVVFLILKEQERNTERAPLALLTAFGWLVVPIWVALFAGTLWQVWLILSGGDSALVGAGRLGAGALLAALLGAPFVIWGDGAETSDAALPEGGPHHRPDHGGGGAVGGGGGRPEDRGGQDAGDHGAQYRGADRRDPVAGADRAGLDDP